MRGLAEDVQHITHAVAHGVHQVKTLLVNAWLVTDGAQCRHHKVHRHDVDAPALQTDRRHPGRQQLAHALNELEEVIRAVHLVHLARGAVAHHHGRPVDRPGHLARLAHDFFALVLGSEIRVLVVFGFFKHVLAEHAFVQTSGRDGAHVVEVTRINGFGQLDGVARAFNVDRNLAGLVGTQVVHGGQVIKMINLAFEFFDVIGGDTQLLGGEVAKHGHHARRTGAPVLAQGTHLVFAGLAH